MRTVEQALSLYKRYVTYPNYSHENYVDSKDENFDIVREYDKKVKEISEQLDEKRKNSVQK